MTSTIHTEPVATYAPPAADPAATTHPGFIRAAGTFAILAALAGWWYATAFVVLRNPLMSAMALMAGGMCATVVGIGLYARLRQVHAPIALLALVATTVGVVGSVIHGGYDLATALHPTSGGGDGAALNAVDPRGLLTFGAAGLGIALWSWSISTSGALPRGLALLGYLSAALSIVLYLGRLIILTPTSPVILGPALLEGFLVSPVWYLWLGLALRKP